MDDIIQRLQVESLNAQISLLQLGRVYLAERCASQNSASEANWDLLRLIEESKQRCNALRGELALLKGRVKPLWG